MGGIVVAGEGGRGAELAADVPLGGVEEGAGAGFVVRVGGVELALAGFIV